MEDWIIQLVDWAGYWGVALLMLLETVFPPIPSEVIMTVAGVSAARGNMTLTGTIAAGTAGAMLGNWLWFWLAIKFGEARLHRFIDKHSRWLTLDWAEVDRGETLFRKYGSTIVLVARMLPTLRSLISIPAGLFGGGRHHCLGMPLALIELEELVTALREVGPSNGWEFNTPIEWTNHRRPRRPIELMAQPRR